MLRFTDDPCRVGSDTGVCLLYRDCKSVMELYHMFSINPKICGFKSRQPLICCPQTISQKSESILFFYSVTHIEFEITLTIGRESNDTLTFAKIIFDHRTIYRLVRDLYK